MSAKWLIALLILTSTATALTTISHTANSDVECVDGVCTETIQVDRINYYDEGNASWKKINNSFLYNGTHWVAQNNDFHVAVRGNVISMTGENGTAFSFSFNLAYDNITVKDNTISYGIRTTGSTKINGVLTFVLTSTGLSKLFTIYSLTSNGNVPYSENINKTLNNGAFTIRELLIYYWASNATDTWLVKYPTTWNESNTTLSFTLNKTWFDAAQYPIYVDPDVTYTTTSPSLAVAFGNSNDAGTVSSTSGDGDLTAAYPTFAEVGASTKTNLTANGYSAISALDSGVANFTSSGTNKEPFLLINFTTKPANSINWVNITLSQSEIAGSDTNCYNFVANWTDRTFYQFAPKVAGTTVLTGTKNITSAAEIAKIVHPTSNVITLLAENQGDAGEGCKVDLARVILNYNSTVLITAMANNNSNAYVGEFVNFTAFAYTTDSNLSGYIFSSNFTGTWTNSSFIPLTQDTNVTIFNFTTAPLGTETGGNFEWKFYANSSTNTWNSTANQSFTFTSIKLLMNWSNIGTSFNDTTCLFNSPCSINQNQTYNLIMNITCLTMPSGKSCGLITSGIRYNDTYVSQTKDALPMYTYPENSPIRYKIANYMVYPLTYVNFAQDTPTSASQNGWIGLISFKSGPTSYNIRSLVKFNLIGFNDTTLIQVLNASIDMKLTYNLGGTGVIEVYNTSDNTTTVNTPWVYTGGSPNWNDQPPHYTLLTSKNADGTYNWKNFTGTINFTEAVNNSVTNNKNLSIKIKYQTEDSATQQETRYDWSGYNSPHLNITANVTNYSVFNPTNEFTNLTLNDKEIYFLNYTINITNTTGFYNITYNISSKGITNISKSAFLFIGSYTPPAPFTCASASCTPPAKNNDWVVNMTVWCNITTADIDLGTGRLLICDVGYLYFYGVTLRMNGFARYGGDPATWGNIYLKDATRWIVNGT